MTADHAPEPVAPPAQDELRMPQLDECTCDAFATSAERHRASCPIGVAWAVLGPLAGLVAERDALRAKVETLAALMEHNPHGIEYWLKVRDAVGELRAALGGDT